MNTGTATAAFITHARARKLSPRTIEAYTWAFGYLRHLQDLPQIPETIEQVLANAADRLAQESLWDLWRRWRTFFRWAADRYDVINPIERVNPRTGQVQLTVDRPIRSKPLPKDLTPNQVHELLEHGCRSRRDRLLVILPLDTGLRLAEIAGLQKTNISPEVIRVLGKGRKTREVPLSQEVLHELMFLGNPDTPWTDRSRRPLSLNGIKTAYRRLFARAGVDAGVHSLRHTFATMYLRRHGDLYRLSRILGHSDVKTTAIYLNLVHEDLVDEHRRVSPALQFINTQGRLI